MKKQIFRLLTVLFIINIALGIDFISHENVLANESISLWFLATDEDYTNAHLLNFDVHGREIVNEIELPANLAIYSATISSHFEYIAIIEGEKKNVAEFTPNSLCLLNIYGEIIWCSNLSLLNIPNVYFGSIPTLIEWSQDMKYIYVASRMQNNIHILTLSIESSEVLLDIKLDDSIELIEELRWLPQAEMLVFIGWNRSSGNNKLYALEILPEAIPQIISPNVNITLGINDHSVIYQSLNNKKITLEIINFSQSTFRIQDIGNDILESRNYFGELDLTNDNLWLAFTDRAVSSDNVINANLYIAELYTGAINLIGSSEFWFDQLEWSPHGNWLAVRNCKGRGPHLCEINIYTKDGEVINIPSTYSENRNPIWRSVSLN